MSAFQFRPRDSRKGNRLRQGEGDKVLNLMIVASLKQEIQASSRQ